MDRPYPDREKRFSVEELEQLEVIVNRVDRQDSNEYYFANVLDISRNGMKLQVPMCLPFGEKIQIRLVSNDDDLHYFGIGTARYVRSASVDSWEVGCLVEPELRPDVIASIINETGKERRKHSRSRIDRDVFLQCEGTVEFVPAKIFDVSEGGFCIVVPESQDVNQRLMIHLDRSKGKKKPIIGQVRWQTKTDDGYRVGCTFVEADSHLALLSDDPKSETVEKLSWILVGSAVVALAFPVLFSFFLPTAKASASKTDRTGSVTTKADEPDVAVVPAEQVWGIDREQAKVETSVSTNDEQPKKSSVMENVEPRRFNSVLETNSILETPMETPSKTKSSVEVEAVEIPNEIVEIPLTLEAVPDVPDNLDE